MIDSYHVLIAFLMFALVSSITPGPNNTMLLISGVNFGFRRTIPHIFGVTLGFTFMVLMVGLGLGRIFETWPILYTILRYVCAAYLIYLAWQIARSGGFDVEGKNKQPISFLKAALFQWANPKAWVMSIASVTTYAAKENFFIDVVLIAGLYIFFVAFSGGVWTAFGNGCRRFLSQALYLQIFNIVMAIMLVLSLYPLFEN